LAVEAEDIDALPGGGFKRDAHCAGEGKTVGEKQVVGALERARSGDRAALMTPVMSTIDQTPVLAVCDASIVPLPGNGTPPRLGSVPVNVQSKTLALAGSDADASGSIPAIIMAAKVVANFTDWLPNGKTASRD
jgi:hypothetical protein